MLAGHGIGENDVTAACEELLNLTTAWNCVLAKTGKILALVSQQPARKVTLRRSQCSRNYLSMMIPIDRAHSLNLIESIQVPN
jgi:hypothetical protein